MPLYFLFNFLQVCTLCVCVCFVFKKKKYLAFLNHKILESHIHVAVSLKVMPRDITGHLKRAGNLRYFVKTHANE